MSVETELRAAAAEEFSAELELSAAEFSSALEKAYLDNAERFPVPGRAGGLASRSEIEKLYGSGALYDEALAVLLPEACTKYLHNKNIRISGRPQVAELSFTEAGGVLFRLKAQLYPKVSPGRYKGLEIRSSRKDEGAFAMAALKAALSEMRGGPNEIMTDQRLDAMAAQEKLNISEDPLYYLLADMTFIMEGAYREAGAPRSALQARAEALEIILQELSGDKKEPSMKELIAQVPVYVSRYRELPENFDSVLERLLEARAKAKGAMSREELVNEAFSSYLGSIGTDEKKWRKERRTEARETAACDLLLEAVAEEEGFEVSEAEYDAMIERIASRCGVSFPEALVAIDKEAALSQLKRDKACRLIVESAVEAPALPQNKKQEEKPPEVK